MFFSGKQKSIHYLSRSDVDDPLASFSHHPFELEGAQWPSVEHYYQGMKFEDFGLREQVRSASHPKDTQAIAKQYKRQIRKDWNPIKQTIMTRGIYVKCRTHPEVAEALLNSGDLELVENSQYDYYWGCGRDQRGDNRYGKLLMQVRNKLREEAAAG